MGKKPNKRKVVFREVELENNTAEEMEEDLSQIPASQIASNLAINLRAFGKAREEEFKLLRETIELQKQEIEQLKSLLAAKTTPTTPEMPAEDDGFTPAPSKRRKETSPSPSTSAPATHTVAPMKLKTAAHPSEQLRLATQAPAAASTENPPAPAPGTTRQQPNTPPIVIAQDQDWLETSEALAQNGILFSRARQCAEGIRIQPEGPENYRRMVSLLQQRGVAFHSYQLQEEKTLKAVIRGVPTSVTEAAALAALKDQGLPATSVTRMKGRYGRPFPLLYIQLERTEAGKKIFRLDKLLNLTIKVETKRRGSAPTQCHRCQGIGHGQSRCERRLVCVKCAGPHAAQNCPRPREEPATCSNCKEPHPANYRGCTAFQRARNPAPRRRIPTQGGPPARKSYANAAAENSSRPLQRKTDFAAIGEVINTLIQAVESAKSPGEIAAAVWQQLQPIIDATSQKLSVK